MDFFVDEAESRINTLCIKMRAFEVYGKRHSKIAVREVFRGSQYYIALKDAYKSPSD